jgi:hypothetical protein
MLIAAVQGICRATGAVQRPQVLAMQKAMFDSQHRCALVLKITHLLDSSTNSECDAARQEELQQALCQVEAMRLQAEALAAERDSLLATVQSQGSHIDVARESVRALQTVLLNSAQSSQAQMRQLEVCTLTTWLSAASNASSQICVRHCVRLLRFSALDRLAYIPLCLLHPGEQKTIQARTRTNA